ncbi:fibronectin, type III [Anaeromyxobacter sp. K]|uniref:cytochrome c3 family protein n=1 Tax=Anaeromyxobacter sp. (strain K) TaxID=447217 RepID=UPI00015F9CC0|nr:cytochrome c3 family protein [Anaeromyxobacter sp. K]ACG71275.1 fibronectin, type III [Anaeromyxobacter sp. K]
MRQPVHRSSRGGLHAPRARGSSRLDPTLAMAFALSAVLVSGCGPDEAPTAASGLAGDPMPGKTVEPAPAPLPPRFTTQALPVAGEVCVGSAAHDKHAASGIGCTACHPCGGALGFANPVTFPGGTTSANGSVVSDASGTTCSVGCHAPLGAEPHGVSWTAGPLQCVTCHTDVGAIDPATALSAHPLPDGSSGTSCQSCHDTSQHLSGEVRMVDGGGGSAAVTCAGCHAGQGQTLSGETPPLLVGWDDLVSGDFHGDRPGTCRFDALDPAGQRSIGRGAYACPPNQPDQPGAMRITPRWWYANGTSGAWAWTCVLQPVDAAGNPVGAARTGQPCPEGTIQNSSCSSNLSSPSCYPTTLVTRGFGGTLLAPYARGQGAIACARCHDFHASNNAFLLAAHVNGVAIPPGSIDRAGVGAQVLCTACHQGDRHEVCKACHRERWVTDGSYSWFEGAPADPAPDGAACFFCHGHEGIQQMEVTSPVYPPNHPYSTGLPQSACTHCHDGWAPPPTEYVAPRFQAGPALSGVTATTATVAWTSSEKATSYVEYGVGTAGHVVGNDAFVVQHSVQLTGLTPGTTYVWRVRTSDVFRNVTHTALQSFTTPAEGALSSPDLAPVSASFEVGTYDATVPLVWFPVTAAAGVVLQYEVQLASDAAFTYLQNGSLTGPGVPGSTVGSTGWVSGTPTTSGGRPALQVPARLLNIPQDSCGPYAPRPYYWRVRVRDQQGHESGWSAPGNFGAFAWDPWC